MTVDERTKKVAKRAAQIGFVLAILCQFAPPNYRVVCEVLAKFCTGGIS
mgnify:CR=1 FL=1